MRLFKANTAISMKIRQITLRLITTKCGVSKQFCQKATLEQIVSLQQLGVRSLFQSSLIHGPVNLFILSLIPTSQIVL